MVAKRSYSTTAFDPLHNDDRRPTRAIDSTVDAIFLTAENATSRAPEAALIAAMATAALNFAASFVPIVMKVLRLQSGFALDRICHAN
jgi:hypothetical protein